MNVVLWFFSFANPLKPGCLHNEGQVSFCALLYLPSGCVSPEVSEIVLKPRVNLVERQLSFRTFNDGLKIWLIYAHIYNLI